MEIMPISESIKFFLKGNKDLVLKNFSEQQVRGFSEIFDLYTSFFQDDGWYLSQIKILQSKDDVEQQVKSEEQKQVKKPQPQVSNIPEMNSQDYPTKEPEVDDEDIKSLFDE
jgi:hypothetical protein